MRKLWEQTLEMYTVINFYCDEDVKELISGGFFPVEDYRRSHFGITIKLMDMRFYRHNRLYHKNKIFLSPQMTKKDRFLIKYAVDYFERRCQEFEFQPDDVHGCRKSRLEQDIPFGEAVYHVYGWLWNDLMERVLHRRKESDNALKR